MLTLTTLILVASFTLAQPTDTLRGPDINQQELESIGTTDMSGNFIPVEGRPELAAFMLVCDDPDERTRARELTTARVFDLAEILVDEIDTVRAITDAIANNNTTLARTLGAQLRLRHDPNMQRDPLRPQLEDMLSEPQRQRLERILDDYWRRWVSANTPEDQRNMQGLPRSEAVYKQIENQLNTQLYQQDIARAYEYSLRRYHDAMQAMYEAIEPTDDQRAWIRNRVIEHIKQTRLQPTLEQREALLLEIYHHLDEDRQSKLFAYMARAAILRN